jgi:hypothetical protein
VVQTGTPALPTGAATESTLSTLNGKVTAVNTGAVVVSSSALPSGAATAAKQPALGTAGTASSDVLTVQGITSMTALKTDGSATTQPVSGTVTANAGSGTMAVSAASLPLPTGAATSAAQTTGNTSVGNIDTNTGAIADASVAAGATGSVSAKLRRLTTDLDSVKTNTSTTATKLTYGTTDFFPQYNNMTQSLPISTVPLLTTSGALLTAGHVSTDAGSVRANFTGSSLLSSLGTCTFTNGSPYVTGSGFANSSVEILSMVKLNADTEASYTPVAYIVSDTQLQLAYPYVGTSATGAASYAPLATVTGTGATISVASGQCTLASGTTNASQSFLYGVSSTGDLQAGASFSISQRISTQDIYFGLEDNALTSITSFSRFRFSGTTNTQVITETAFNPTTTPSASETESNTITLPNGATTASQNFYKIAVTQDNIVFSINNIVVATHTKRLPHIRRTSNTGFTTLDIRVLNGTGASNTNIVVDYITGRIYDRIDTIQSSPGDITNAQVVSQKSATTGSNTLQSAVSATGNGTSLVTDGMATASFTVSGTFTATVTFEGTQDGSTWTGLNTVQAGTSVISSTTTTTGVFVASCTGFSSIRARVTWTSGTSVTVTATASPLNTGIRVLNANSTFAGTAASVNNGTVDAATQRVTIASDSTGTVGLSPKTSGGWTTYHLVSAATTNATNLKASAGQVGGWYIYNSNAAARKIAFHNTAGTPTAGASVFLAIVIPPLSAANVEFTNGIPFSTGIAITTVTDLADSGTTAVALNDLNVNIFYK